MFLEYTHPVMPSLANETQDCYSQTNIIDLNPSSSIRNDRYSHCHVSSDQFTLGWLGYIGDEILPTYIGIIMRHYKDPYSPARKMECHKGFDPALLPSSSIISGKLNCQNAISACQLR